MSALDKRVGQNLQRLRRRAAYAPTVLATALKVSVADLRRFETGEKRVGPRRLWQLSQILDCPLAAFFARAPRTFPSTAVPTVEIADRVRDQVVALARAYYVLGDWSTARS